MPSTRRKPASSSGETEASLRELTEVSGNGAAALRTLVSVEGETKPLGMLLLARHARKARQGH